MMMDWIHKNIIMNSSSSSISTRNCDDADIDTAISFMFDSEHPKIHKTARVGDVDIKLKTIGDDPGHVQSGQYIWPAALSLSSHIVDVWPELKAETVLELGAGCGMVGITCAGMKDCKSVILTDYDPGSLKLLEENIVLNRESMGACNCFVTGLMWGDIESANALLGVASAQETRLPLLVGSDLIYCKDVIRPLFETVASLLSIKGIFILASSFDIGQESNDIFDAECSVFGFSVETIQHLIEEGGGGHMCKIQYISKRSIYDEIYENVFKTR
jgi:predicted nicotinamide N-methyase